MNVLSWPLRSRRTAAARAGSEVSDLLNAAQPPYDNFTSGYGYAIQTYSAVVLGLLYERCKAMGMPQENCYLKDDWA